MKENYLSPDCQNKRFVYGVRIWLKDGHQPMADLALGDGGRPSGEVHTIHWDDNTQRSNYVINAYTLIWDSRAKSVHDSFSEYLEANAIGEIHFEEK